jgi:hypothetical protein
MVTTVSQSLFESLTPSQDLHSLEEFDISGANDAKVPYKGYDLLDLSIPSLESDTTTVTVLVGPATTYS